MRISGLLLALLALTAGAGRAQQELPPSANDGPMEIKQAPPAPGKDGVYSPGPGIQSPVIVDRVFVTYPNDVPSSLIDGICVVSLVVGADGEPSNIEVVAPFRPEFDAAMVEAVKQTKFAAGTLDDKPVPVRINMRVRFFDDKRPAIPRIVGRFGIVPHAGALARADRKWDKPPMATYQPNPEYSEKARKARLQGVVIVSLTVSEEGMPTNVKLEKSLGMGLDENAIACVSQYRFKPAVKDGVTVPAHIFVEVNFRLY